MPRRKRPLDRDGGTLRDASLLVIASEDRYAAKQYFGRFRTRRIQFLVVPTSDGRSSPTAVMERLDEFKRSNATEVDDQFWVCIDLDHWAGESHMKNLTDVLSHCRRKGYRVAISNPCFELWLLLHLEDLPTNVSPRCDEIAARLATLLGGYNKAKCCSSIQFTAEMVHDAVRRAEASDTADAIPTRPLSRVHLILKELMARDSIDLT